MAAPEPPLLEEHRLRAFRVLHQPCWPATLEETVRDPIRQQLIELYARQCARAEQRVLAFSTRVLRPPTPAATPQRRSTDLKRAAAGDRDDD